MALGSQLVRGSSQLAKWMMLVPLAACGGSSGGTSKQQQNDLEGAFWDQDPTVTARAEKLLAEMTLEEKVDMLHGELNGKYGFYNAPIPRLGIPALLMADGRNGVRLANPEANDERSTLLPAAISLAASWDESVAARQSSVSTDETFRTGQNVALSPALNIARVAQNGRVFESFGEDPLLQGRLGSTYVSTTQGYGGVIANVQDWAVYTQETNRLEGDDMLVPERALREIYVRPWAKTIEEAHPGSVMCGFNKVNGEYSCGSDFLLNQLLKTQLEFEGWVLTDYGANKLTLDINAGLDQEQPGNTAVNLGGDQAPVSGRNPDVASDASQPDGESDAGSLADGGSDAGSSGSGDAGSSGSGDAGPSSDPYGAAGSCLFCGPLIAAVNEGQVSIERIDNAVLRILRPMFGLGLFDRSYAVQSFDEAAHSTASTEIAEQGIVLLKNADGILPLSADVGSIAVIGTDADVLVQGGGSSYISKPTFQVSALDGIRKRVGSATDVSFVAGTDPVNSSALLPGAQPIPSSFLRPETGSGNGLSAKYYLNETFSGTPTIDRVEPYVGLNGGLFLYSDFNAASPHFPKQPQSLDTDMSARWSGSLVVPTTGTYEIQVVTNGAATLTIDGTEVIKTEAWTPKPSAPNQTVSVSRTFAAGSTHAIVLSYAFNQATEAWNGGGPQIKLGWVPPKGVTLPQATEAASAAAAADVAIVLVRDFSSEAGDRPDLQLPNWQSELIQAVASANPNTVVVMTAGGAVRVLDWQDKVRGLVHAWYPGQNQGTAIARVLFGDVNPSGKLPITMPTDIDQTPTSKQAQFPGDGLNVSFSEGIFEGYRGYLEYGITPSYPFGFGLSYTTFEFSELTAPCGPFTPSEQDSKQRTEPDGGDTSCESHPLQVSVQVTNTGSVAGSEVVQAYAGRLPGAPVPTASRSLAGWAKVRLEPGESTRVTIALDVESLSYWDVNTDRWVTPPGDVPVYVGSSSASTPLDATVKIVAGAEPTK